MASLLSAIGSCERKVAYLPTGCDGLDTLLGGGIGRGSITEITGPSASGKSQLCLQLALHAALSSLEEKETAKDNLVLYITSFKSLCVARMEQILQAHPRFQNTSEMDIPTRVLGQILTASATNLEQLNLLLADTRPFCLIIIDDVTNILKADADDTSGEGSRPGFALSMARGRYKLAKRLRKLSLVSNLAVVVVNQVVDVFQRPGAPQRPHHFLEYAYQAPALGDYWSYLVHTRLFLVRPGRMGAGFLERLRVISQADPQVYFRPLETRGQSTLDLLEKIVACKSAEDPVFVYPGTDKSVRYLYVAKSPTIAPQRQFFDIQESGIVVI